MKRTKFLLLVILPILTLGQSKFCNKSFGESYFPLEVGFEKHITWGNTFYIEKVVEKTVIDGKEYYKYVQDFRNGTTYDLLLRNQNDTIYIHNKIKKKDRIFLIVNPKKGLKWESGKIIDINGNFETPYCDYKNLIVIENKYSNGMKEKRYYKKGLGLIAITSKKEIKGICLPNKEEAESLMKPLSFEGCEKELEKSKITECTMKSIHLYVINELKKLKTKPLKENGILKFKVNIAKTGYVSNVEYLNSISGSNKIRRVIKKIIESLPKFTPTKTADKKAVGTNIKISIPIKVK